MFGWFKADPSIKLQKVYDEKLRQAMEAQRNGDIRLYSELSHQAEEIGREIDALQTSKTKG